MAEPFREDAKESRKTQLAKTSIGRPKIHNEPVEGQCRKRGYMENCEKAKATSGFKAAKNKNIFCIPRFCFTKENNKSSL